MIFDNFGRHFGAPRVSFSDSVLKRGSKGGAQSKKKQKQIIAEYGYKCLVKKSNKK